MTDQFVDEDHEDHEDVFGSLAGDDLDDGLDGPVGDDDDEDNQRQPRQIEGQTSWVYIVVLGAVFLLLVLFSWACNDRSSTAGEPLTEEEAATEAGGSAVDLGVSVDGDIVTLTGAVPDEAAKNQILQTAGDIYGAENVIDELVVDESATLDDGVLSVSGAAPFDDQRPEALRDGLSAGLGLTESGFEIDRGEASVSAVAIEGRLASGVIRYIGVVPDQVSVSDLVAATEAALGPGSADVSGLTVGDATWTDGAIRVTGSARLGDTSIDGLAAQVQQRFGALVTVDTSEIGLDQSTEVLAEIQEEISAELELQPIQFAPLLAEIEAESDAVLVSIAEKLQSIPDVTVEVVGHTDNAGSEEDNQVLSEQRATAVVDRLVELGVDAARLNARGEGELIPIADNDTPEGREQNRRIEFLLVAG